MSASLVIRHGQVVNASGICHADVAISDGVITAIGADLRGDDEIDARGLLVLPGGVDAHTHLQTQSRLDGPSSPSDYYHGTVAAACGGITTIVDYARQYPGMPLDEALAYWRGLAEPKAVIDYGFHLTLADAHPERTLRPLAEMVAHGVTTFKIFMMRHSDRDILALMHRIAESRGMAMMHCESAAIGADAYERLAATGRQSARSWSESRPLASEFEAVSRAIDYARYTGCPIYLVHISCAEAIRRIRAGRQVPQLAWVETRPCYLLFTEERYADQSSGYLGYTGYPPLRAAEDVEAIWSAVADDTIQIIGSDHAAWSMEQKVAAADDLAELPIGLPSLETQSRALYTVGVRTGRIDVTRFVALTSTNPAIAMGLYPRKGTIAVGSDADITLWDPDRTGTIRAQDMHGGLDYEPCDGMECTGWPVRTISRGETIVLDGTPTAAAGRGKFLARSASGKRDGAEKEYNQQS